MCQRGWRKSPPSSGRRWSPRRNLPVTVQDNSARWAITPWPASPRRNLFSVWLIDPPAGIGASIARSYMWPSVAPLAESPARGQTGGWSSSMPLRDVKLDDKYDLGHSHIFATGFQALVRLCLMQKELDRRSGLNTAGYVSGYRGSPLGGLDSQFLRAKSFLEKSDIRFQGGINEDLAATAVWGSQQAELRGEGKYDGVFGMWYGKGPGVDRTGDVFRHANFAGSSKHGGVLALMGDDHTAQSSTTAHQSEYHFIDVMIPILNPAGVQEILDYGLYGWGMSPFTGTLGALT